MAKIYQFEKPSDASEPLDQTPKYTIRQVSRMVGLSTYTLRYYDKLDLFPFVCRSSGNARMFSPSDVEWIRMVHCLRGTGMSLSEVKHYIGLCLQGDGTIAQRAEIIFRQEEVLKEQVARMCGQLADLQVKKAYYIEMLEKMGRGDESKEDKPKRRIGAF